MRGERRTEASGLVMKAGLYMRLPPSLGVRPPFAESSLCSSCTRPICVSVAGYAGGSPGEEDTRRWAGDLPVLVRRVLLEGSGGLPSELSHGLPSTVAVPGVGPGASNQPSTSCISDENSDMVKLVRGYVAGIVRPVDDVQLPSGVGNASPSGMLGVLQEFKPISDKKASSDGVKAAKLRNVLLRPPELGSPGI